MTVKHWTEKRQVRGCSIDVVVIWVGSGRRTRRPYKSASMFTFYLYIISFVTIFDNLEVGELLLFVSNFINRFDAYALLECQLQPSTDVARENCWEPMAVYICRPEIGLKMYVHQAQKS